MRPFKHPILLQLAFLTHVIESESSDEEEKEKAILEKEKIIVQCCLN